MTAQSDWKTAVAWESRKQAVRGALLMNGVGALLVLVFLAHLHNLARTRQVPVADFILDLASVLGTLVVGILLGASVYLLDAANIFIHGEDGWLARSSRVFGILLIATSYGCFAYAAYETRAAFLDHLPLP